MLFLQLIPVQVSAAVVFGLIPVPLEVIREVVAEAEAMGPLLRRAGLAR